MSNLQKGIHNVNLAGKDYQTRLTLDSIVEIEQATGTGIIKLCQRMAESDISITDIILVLNKGLRGGGNDVQEKDTKKIIEKAGIIESTRAVATMLTASLTTDSDEEGTKKNEE
jgi:hypothetical protein